MNIKQRSSWISTVKSLTKDVLVLSCHPDDGYTLSMVKLVEKLVKHHGKRHALKTLKSYSTWLQLYMLKQNPEPLPFHQVDRDGFPKVLRPWKALTRSNYKDARLLISLWRVPECLKLDPSHDISTITEPGPDTEELLKDFKHWLKTWGGLSALANRPDYPEMILSNRRGPNGLATAYAFSDLAALRADPELYASVKQALKKNLTLDQYTPTEGNFVHSVIRFLPDKFGKTRVIAIGDWFSNVALSGLHSSFMKGLSRLSTDLTYRQSLLPDLIKGLGNNLYSTDLTAATDRFPVSWEEAVVSAKYGEEVGSLWKKIISCREFSIKGNPNKVRYAVGNPMGFLSSWPVFAFTHHAFIEWCAHLAGINRFRGYLVLGDDNICNNSIVASKYKEMLTKIGVPISLSKCTSSNLGYAEMAKRLFTPEGEITGIPVTILKGIRKNPDQFIELVRIMRERNYSDTDVVPAVQALCQTCRNKNDILLVLTLPEEISGIRPLNGLEPSYGAISDAPLAVPLQDALKISREVKFWSEVDKIAEYAQKGAYPVPERGDKLHIPEDHPALYTLGYNLTSEYMGNPTEIYDRWMEGKDYHLAQVPNIDLYRYENRGHYVTKARYDILKNTVAYSLGRKELPVINRPRITNVQLFQLGFPRE
jgi:hypothetical protein